jgi:uncharacterized protein
MTAFATTNKAPGVYIQEIQLPGPIAGVGTSTAAFVGPARRGPMRKPERLANWTRYVELFGVDSIPFFADAPVYTPIAVQGFFDNGGSDCWFVRVGTAVQASLPLDDANGNPTLVVTAQQEGVAGNNITAQVQNPASPPLATTTLLRASVPITMAQNTTVQLGSPADARKFVPRDVVFLEDANNSETATVASVSGDTLTLTAALQNTYDTNPPSTLRLADLQAGATTIRLGDANGVPNVAGIEPGSYLAISTSGGTPEHTVVQRVDSTSGRVWITPALQNGYALDPGATQVDVVSEEFTLVIGGSETFAQLSMDPRHTHYFATAVESELVTVAPADPPNASRPPDNMPVDTTATTPTPTLQGGVDDDPGNVTPGEFIRGIDALKPIDEVNILCVPDSVDQGVQGHMITHCDQLQDRFAVLDPRPRANSETIGVQRDGLGSDRGFAALYYPQIIVADPVVAGGRVTVPPSGHLAGIYARVDGERGVFKAPANEIMRGVLDLERVVTEEEQGPLNEDGINVIRSFPGRGAVVWGARTISQSTQWRYVNIRRFLLFVEESLKEGTLFTVFEPNTPTLWGQVKRQVTEFLTRQFTAGALVGTTPDEAFIVQVDEELNTPAVMALGQLIIKVTLFPATPAEFVVFKIIQQPGGPLVEE